MKYSLPKRVKCSPVGKQIVNWTTIKWYRLRSVAVWYLLLFVCARVRRLFNIISVILRRLILVVQCAVYTHVAFQYGLLDVIVPRCSTRSIPNIRFHLRLFCLFWHTRNWCVYVYLGNTAHIMFSSKTIVNIKQSHHEYIFSEFN